MIPVIPAGPAKGAGQSTARRASAIAVVAGAVAAPDATVTAVAVAIVIATTAVVPALPAAVTALPDIAVDKAVETTSCRQQRA